MENKRNRDRKTYLRFRELNKPFARSVSIGKWLRETFVSGVIFSVLLFILINFYVFASIISVDSFIYVFLILTLLTDGLFLLLQMIRRPSKTPELFCDPRKVSAIIACYNGAADLSETIKQLKRQIPAWNIWVVSDASTDDTAHIASRLGAHVIVNKKNMNKAFSVSIGAHHVTTPYALVLDDDVLIGDSVIPTNLMDDGYSAVAFDIMPIKTDTFVNTLQQFEYRNSMRIGKNLRARSNSIGNISGAIGLYHTVDLKEQAYLHSGQFAGEDEQRTLLTHIYGKGKGIAFSGQTVYTHAPNTFHALYRQRAYSWSLAVPELLVLYFRVLFSPRYHYLMKAEKAYYIYIYLTDPLRMLFLWTLVLRPRYFFLTYSLYFFMNLLVWFRTGCKDHFLTVLLYPVYTLWLSLCRFIGNFYWLKVKFSYFRKHLHKLVVRRRLRLEFAIVLFIFLASWMVSGYRFASDIRLFNKIRYSRLEEQTTAFNYDSSGSTSAPKIDALELTFSQTIPPTGTYIVVDVEKGDTLRAVAHKTVDRYLSTHLDMKVPYAKRAGIDQKVIDALKGNSVYYNYSTSSLLITNDIMDKVFAS